MKSLWLCLVAVALMATTGTTRAQEFSLSAGPSVTSAHRETGAIFAQLFGDAPEDGRIHFEPIGSLGWFDARNTSREHMDHDVFIASGGVRIVAANHHWFVGEQIGATSGRTDALSSRFEFMTSIGCQIDRFVIQLQHVSNGHLLGGGRNLGETMLLAGVRWK